MFRRLRAAILPVALAFTGCFEPEIVSLVPDMPYSGLSSDLVSAKQAAYARLTGERAERLIEVGKKVVMANQQVGLRPLFRTLGSPTLEIFHKGTSEIIVTEGLVTKCETEGQLAAVLALELGKMVSEREARQDSRRDKRERQQPIDLRVGNDVVGINGGPDMTHMAEMAEYQKNRPPADAAPTPPPDPRALARLYLIKTGFAASELDAVDTILDAAAQNGALEKQLLKGSSEPSWAPAAK